MLPCDLRLFRPLSFVGPEVYGNHHHWICFTVLHFVLPINSWRVADRGRTLPAFFKMSWVLLLHWSFWKNRHTTYAIDSDTARTHVSTLPKSVCLLYIIPVYYCIYWDIVNSHRVHFFCSKAKCLFFQKEKYFVENLARSFAQSACLIFVESRSILVFLLLLK